MLLFFLTSIPLHIVLAQSGLPKPETVVKPKVYLSLEAVPRGADFEIAVAGEILPGFHVNSNQVLEDYLIPTTIQPDVPPGFRLMQTNYPQGKLKKFPFADKEMSVYESRFLIRMKFKAPAGTPLGAAKMQFTLRYQACNDSTCLPPVKIPVTADFEIATADTKPRPANPEIFTKR